MNSKVVKADMSGLQKFAQSISKTTEYRTRVGILGSKANRTSKGGMTNADIGFIHEFGGPKTPKRSFLRMPIFQKSEQILKSVKEAGALKKLAAGNVVMVLADMGVGCEAAILEAFGSAGFGSWKKNAPRTIKKKGSSAPLIDTGQLRRSISSAVVRA